MLPYFPFFESMHITQVFIIRRKSLDDMPDLLIFINKDNARVKMSLKVNESILIRN